jgi:hypothetical protein
VLAQRAIQAYIEWVGDVAEEHPILRNIAVGLWALADKEEYGEVYDSEDKEPSDDEELSDVERKLYNLVDAYYQSGSHATGEVSGSRGPNNLSTASEARIDDGTVAYMDNSQFLSDSGATRADIITPAMVNRLLDSSYGDSYASETRVEQEVIESFTSFERDRVQEQRRSVSVHSDAALSGISKEFDVGQVIDNRFEVADVRRGGMGCGLSLLRSRAA